MKYKFTLFFTTLVTLSLVTLAFLHYQHLDTELQSGLAGNNLVTTHKIIVPTVLNQNYYNSKYKVSISYPQEASLKDTSNCNELSEWESNCIDINYNDATIRVYLDAPNNIMRQTQIGLSDSQKSNSKSIKIDDTEGIRFNFFRTADSDLGHVFYETNFLTDSELDSYTNYIDRGYVFITVIYFSERELDTEQLKVLDRIASSISVN